MTQDRNAVTTLTRLRRLFDRPGRTLGAAVVVSLAAHLILAALPAPPLAAPEAPVLLSATLTEMPPPPAPPSNPPAPHKRKPKPAPPVVAAPTPEPEAAAATATSEPESAPQAEAAAPESAVPPSPVEETAPVVAETTPAPPEHSGSRYSITTVAQARGLAALFIRGEGRLASVGTITRTGLQPDQYSAERTSDGRHEVATFDWESGIVLLNDNKTAALALPTFDPLAVLWQFYFMPPEEDETQFNVATTRRVYHAHFRRVGTETLTLPFRDVETEVWERDGGDGNLTARVWLAPSLHHVMVKMRLSNGRITGEALLDSIRVDETVAQQ
jgi:uncharacterized protein DUF3108